MLPFGGALLGPIVSGIGAAFDYFSGRQQQAENLNAQREFAQNGIKWRVDDANRAGIHPLYALGANPVSFSPTTVGTNFAQVGQDISRAIDVTRSSSEKVDARLAGLQLERAGLENELLRSQIIGSKAALLRQNGPPMPSATPDERVGPAFWNDELFARGTGTTSAQAMENNYGEGVGDTWGLFSFLNNVGNTWMLQRALQVAAQKERARRGLPTYPVGFDNNNDVYNSRR